MRPAYFYSTLVAVFAALFVGFGYLDSDLSGMQQWFGSVLILTGMGIALPAILRLAADWKRLKPEHNVDLAFLQVGAGVAVLVVACMLGGNAQKVIAPLFNPTPQIVRPQEQASR